jgi:subtilase family serine protease
VSIAATLVSVGLAQPAVGRHGAGAVRPLSTGHVLFKGHFMRHQPLTTAVCEQFGHIACYDPGQFQQAYNLHPLYDRGLDGHGQTIVIVDSFGSPTIKQDLHFFDNIYGLADPPNFNVITPVGAPPRYDMNDFTMTGWAIETTLDVEMAHAIAPGANIVLVETPVAETEGVEGFPEIVSAENYVINNNLGDVISQSFGATEDTFPSNQDIYNLRGAFINAYQHKVTVLAASGDSGPTGGSIDLTCCEPYQINGWPSSDPLVTSVGGTQLHLDDAGNRTSPDNVWNDFGGAGGGGPSHVFSRPSYQDSVRRVVGSHRGTPDVSMSAAVDGGAIIYGSFRLGFLGGAPADWFVVGGTSESSPLFAGIVAIANQAAGHRLGFLNPKLYALAGQSNSGIVDITIGNNTFTFCSTSCGTPDEVDVTVQGYQAVRGYDMASGLGTVDATRFVGALAGSD